jgi:hypothetical protein
MPSNSLTAWLKLRTAKLDEIESAHQAVGGSARGRRYATEQINQAYLVMVSSQFQGFCRDLHSECVDFLVVRSGGLGGLGAAMAGLASQRKLDFGNPNPGNLGMDFGRLGMEFWTVVSTWDMRVTTWQKRLQGLNEWRNAIAHQDFTKVGRSVVRLAEVRQWRSTCQGLARTFDKALSAHLRSLAGVTPW